MFTRAVIAFLALPGIVAFLVPAGWIWFADLALHWPFGLLVVALGFSGLLWCARDFYVSGKGTLAPWAPPQALVVVGLYRYSRNPMYVAVALILLAGLSRSVRSACSSMHSPSRSPFTCGWCSARSPGWRGPTARLGSSTLNASGAGSRPGRTL